MHGDEALTAETILSERERSFDLLYAVDSAKQWFADASTNDSIIHAIWIIQTGFRDPGEDLPVMLAFSRPAGLELVFNGRTFSSARQAIECAAEDMMKFADTLSGFNYFEIAESYEAGFTDAHFALCDEFCARCRAAFDDRAAKRLATEFGWIDRWSLNAQLLAETRTALDRIGARAVVIPDRPKSNRRGSNELEVIISAELRKLGVDATIRKIAGSLGVAQGSVAQSKAWRAFHDERKARGTAAPRASFVPDLGELVAEQARDDLAHRVYPRP